MVLLEDSQKSAEVGLQGSGHEQRNKRLRILVVTESHGRRPQHLSPSFEGPPTGSRPPGYAQRRMSRVVEWSRDTPLAPIYVTQDGGYGGPWASVRIVFRFDSTSCFLQTWAADTCSWFYPIAIQIGNIIKHAVLHCALGPDLASTSLIRKPRAQRLAVCLFERAG